MKTKELIKLLKKENLAVNELMRVVNEIDKLKYKTIINIKNNNNTIDVSIECKVNDSDSVILNTIKILVETLISFMNELKMDKHEKIYCLNKFISYYIAKSELNEYEEYFKSNKN